MTVAKMAFALAGMAARAQVEQDVVGTFQGRLVGSKFREPVAVLPLAGVGGNRLQEAGGGCLGDRGFPGAVRAVLRRSAQPLDGARGLDARTLRVDSGHGIDLR